MMKRLLVLLFVMLNLCVVGGADGFLRVFCLSAHAQHMELEGGRYDCLDDEIGWYRSLIPCDSLIVEPEETYACCTYCHGKYPSNKILDHEYACPSRRKDEDPWGADEGNGSDSGGGSGSSGGSGSGGGGENSAGGGSSSGGGGFSGSSSNASKTTYIKLVTKETVHGIKVTVPELCPIGLEGAYIAGFAYDDGEIRYLDDLDDFGWEEDVEIVKKVWNTYA